MPPKREFTAEEAKGVPSRPRRRARARGARPELLISRLGQPYTVFGLNKECKNTVFEYTAHAMNLHLVQDV